jgi:anthranilate synthase/aminodeoxychorismate synthase-like glutamine amidotransferase
MLVIIDNYDSFTYNLVQFLGELGAQMRVFRNDQFTLEALETFSPQGIIISPGPGYPDHAGLSLAVIRQFAGKIPILGVCLGHQCIGQYFGGRIVRAPEPLHGKVSSIHHNGLGLYAGLPNPFTATRYHSLMIDPDTLPATLEVTATSEDGVIMGVRHREFAIDGVQFHPESILTSHGSALLKNFLSQMRHERTA